MRSEREFVISASGRHLGMVTDTHEYLPLIPRCSTYRITPNPEVSVSRGPAQAHVDACAGRQLEDLALKSRDSIEARRLGKAVDAALRDKGPIWIDP